jgi:hypothetical protein
MGSNFQKAIGRYMKGMKAERTGGQTSSVAIGSHRIAASLREFIFKLIGKLETGLDIL